MLYQEETSFINKEDYEQFFEGVIWSVDWKHSNNSFDTYMTRRRSFKKKQLESKKSRKLWE